MSRISIEVTEEEHNQLKAIASLSGKSIKDYVLERTLPAEPGHEEKAMNELKSFLKSRIEAAERGLLSPRSAINILEEISAE